MYSEFRQFLKNYVYNDVQLQEPFSTVCGHYCVLLLDICLLDTVWNRLFVNWNLIRMQTLKESL